MARGSYGVHASHQLGVTSGARVDEVGSTVREVCYERISVEPFREPPGSEASAKGLPRRGQST
jgi:hypothetical protein